MRVFCDAPTGKGACGALCEYERENYAQMHVFFRCPTSTCKNLMVVCENPDHIQ